MVEYATRIALGESLKDLGLPLGLVPNKPYVAVKHLYSPSPKWAL